MQRDALIRKRVPHQNRILALRTGAHQRHWRFDQFLHTLDVIARLGGEMEGWSGTTAGARSWAQLPAQAIKYIQRVQELIETPVALVSTSPEREDTILVRDPFAD